MRKPRIFIKGAIYHITHRINNSLFYLKHKDMKEMMYRIVLKAQEKYNFELLNFCIMENHVHFLLKPIGKDVDELARICQWIFSGFARKYNNLHGTCGHVWYDRYKSKIINDLQYLENVMRYICENPVRAGLIKNPLDYQYCGISMVASFIDKNCEWGLFRTLSNEVKEKWRSMVRIYKDIGNKKKPYKVLKDDLDIKEWDKCLSFHAKKNKWCIFGDRNYNDQKKYRNKYPEKMDSLYQANLQKDKMNDFDFWNT
jgi:REP element-mobilizing transposase RayT